MIIYKHATPLHSAPNQTKAEEEKGDRDKPSLTPIKITRNRHGTGQGGSGGNENENNGGGGGGGVNGAGDVNSIRHQLQAGSYGGHMSVRVGPW